MADKPNIHAAFAAAYQEVQNPTRNATNSHFGNAYATLEEVLAQVKPVLATHGLLLLQPIVSDGEGVGVRTIIRNADGDELDFGSFVLPLAKKDAQGAGSCISYARRYSLKSLWGLAEEDDDGNEAAKSTPKVEPKPDANPQPSAEALAWEATVSAYTAHGTKPAVMERLGKPTSGKKALAAYHALSDAEKGALMVVALGGTAK